MDVFKLCRAMFITLRLSVCKALHPVSQYWWVGGELEHKLCVCGGGLWGKPDAVEVGVGIQAQGWGCGVDRHGASALCVVDDDCRFAAVACGQSRR